MRAVPEGLSLCTACGDLAGGEYCPACEQLSDRYDVLYHSKRAAELFATLEREMPANTCPLAPARGIAIALKLTAIVAVALVVAGILMRGHLWAS